MRPLIGITPSLHQEYPKRDWLYNTSAYFRSVQLAGGIPVLLPLCETEEEAGQILDRIDGVLFSGGNDVDPQLYGEHPHQDNGEISPERDTTELALARVALSRNMPVLGICRGHQLLAVAAGGTLWQDIPAQRPGTIKHAQEAPRWHPTHTVTVRPDTRLAEVLGSEAPVRVNSYHHQAVKDVPPGWVASAAAPDGINEAMELPGARFMLSVQWHPENFAGRSYNFDALFAAFVAACGPNT